MSVAHDVVSCLCDMLVREQTHQTWLLSVAMRTPSCAHITSVRWQARQWREALLCAQQTAQGELVTSAVQPAAEEAAAALTAEAATDAERIRKYQARLDEVRYHACTPCSKLCMFLVMPETIRG